MNNILLIGNPNVGKSSIFNKLTLSHEQTGNWTGKTVELASKKIIGTNYTLIDLPGIYSLSSLSEEEAITKNTLLFENYKKVIYVSDGTNLEKNLYLLLQILQITKEVILCINMVDILEIKNIKIDTEKLSEILGIKVIRCSTFKNIGFKELIESLDAESYSLFSYTYSKEIEEHIYNISKLLPDYFNDRYISLSVLSKDKNIVEVIKEKYGIDIINKGVNDYLMSINGEDISDEISLTINKLSKEIINKVYLNNSKGNNILDKFFSNKLVTIILMFLIMFSIFFITIVLSNYPSELLSFVFSKIENILYNIVIYFKVPQFIYEPLLFGIYRIVTFIVSVMFPPLVIFFLLYTYAEESGILPRIAFNLDKVFSMCGCHGKQCLTMCTGFGCNACAVVGSRIIDSKRDKLIAILTNSFIPCNGRFPMIIAFITMFLVNSNNRLLISLYLCLFIGLSIIISFLVSFILSKTILRGYPGFFVLELPDYKKVKITKILKESIVYKSLSILKKAIKVSIPCGIIIWIFTNIKICNMTLFESFSYFLNPFAKMIGLDGVILFSFLLALPANEIVIPIIMMGYLGLSNVSTISNYLEIKNVLINNGWTINTAISTILFSIMHFPCGTTLSTIRSEVGTKWMIYSFFIPLICGITILFIFNLII